MKTWEEITGLERKEHNNTLVDKMRAHAILDLLEQSESEGLIARNLPSEEEINKIIDDLYDVSLPASVKAIIAKAISDRIKNGGINVTKTKK